MRPGWYIVNYHSVDFEDSILTRAVGGTVRPDVFEHHVRMLRDAGHFISIPEGQQRLERGEPFSAPVFSLWFDDGYRGVHDYVAPICRELGIRPALSICSRFLLRTEMFWRAKLSYLKYTGGMDTLRARLETMGMRPPERLRTWTLREFDTQLLDAIDAVYRERSDEQFRTDAFRLFADDDQINSLAQEGWYVTNHSAAHYPLADGSGWPSVKAWFDECEVDVRRHNPANRYWVIPFGFGSEFYRRELDGAATVVEVGERFNTPDTWASTGRLFRYAAPLIRDVVSQLR